MMRRKSQLEEVRNGDSIVRVYREDLEDGWVDGFVVALGDDFIALEVFDKASRLDGYNCLRYRDISELLVPAPNAAFLTKALKARGLARSNHFNVDVSSLPALLASAGRSFPLISVFYEGQDNVCWIGRVATVTELEVRLTCINPDARFDREPSSYLLDGITRVDFGGSYEEALHLVAGLN